MLNLIKRSVSALAAMMVAGRDIPSYWHRLYLCCVVLMAMLTYAPAAHAWSGSPSSLGCNGADFCIVPSSNPGYTLTLKDGDWVPLVWLHTTGPREGVWVTVINQATNSTRVALRGQEDGLPLKTGQELTFFYQKDRSGILRLEAEPRLFSFFNKNPMPSFNGGVVQLDVDPQDNPGMPKELLLPANPMDGSVYRLFLNHSSPQSVVVKAGSASYTLSANMKEAYFVAQNGVWRITINASPNSLGCRDGAASCQLPSDALGYTFTVKDFDWVSLVKLPDSPREGDWVKVINQANYSTRVAVDGNNNDGVPLTKGQELSFNYRKDRSGTLRWEAPSRVYQEVNKNPLPSFNRGVVQLVVEPYNNPDMPNPLILPVNPADGSVYRLSLSTRYHGPRTVEVNAGGGSSYTLSDNMMEGYFVAQNGVWILTSASPSQLGCHGVSSSCQLPSGKAGYSFNVTEKERIALVKLPTSPREGDWVTVISLSPYTTQPIVAVDGNNNDGLPLKEGQELSFIYRKDPTGALRWQAEPRLYSFFNKNPLPSFNRGGVQLDVDPQGGSPTTLSLPANPADGSSYHLYLNHSSPQAVTINTGSGNVTLSASRKAAWFFANGGRWVDAATYLPSGLGTYTVTDANWTPEIILPTSPVRGDQVTVNNKSAKTIRVRVDGNGDGVEDGAPLKAGRSLPFYYSLTPFGLKWVAHNAHYNFYNKNPLPSFNRGTLAILFEEKSGAPSTINLPATPADGSLLRLYLGHANAPTVAINTGSGNITLSASLTEAYFIARSGRWESAKQLPSGQASYTVTDANWTAIIKLPASPKEGDKVTVTNKAAKTIKVAVDGINGDGLPLKKDQARHFDYQKSPSGALQWTAGSVYYNFYGQNPLPSFNRGAVLVDVDPQDGAPTSLSLPISPADGSSYHLYLNHSSPQAVTINTGAGNVTLSASRKAALFVASGGQWRDESTAVQVPSSPATYTVTDANWIALVKLPTSPKEGDKVTVTNSAITPTRVTIDGTPGIPVQPGISMVFTYQPSSMGPLIWVADAKNAQGSYCANAGAPCTLPPFNAGKVLMGLSSAGANRFDLPPNPAAGSFYELTANTRVWVNPGSGAVELAQGQTQQFRVVNQQWQQLTELDTTPAAMGCQNSICLLPAGLEALNMTLTDSNHTAHIQLPPGASEGDTVVIDNQQAGQSVRVSVTGMEGVPVGPNQRQFFVFTQTRLGVAQWTTSGHLDQICPGSAPCVLPSFANGYLQYSGTSAKTTKVTLPPLYDMAPAGIELLMASDATNLIQVENGGGLFTLSAAEDPLLVFQSEYTEWQPVLTHSPRQLNCDNSNVCVLPAGNPDYVFELSNRDRVPQLKLPANPVMGQQVLVKNHSNEPSYVSVTGRTGDGLAVAGGSQLRFTYRQSDARLTQWVADKVSLTHCSTNSGVSCSLHSFDKGYAHVDLTGLSNTSFELPGSPQPGSIYVVSNNNKDGWSTRIIGKGDTVLGAKELRQFYVKDGVWDYDHAQNGFDPKYHEIKELTVLYDGINGQPADIYANGNMRTPVTVMAKVFDTFTQKPIDIYNTPGLVKLYDHNVGTGTNRNAWIIPDENPVGNNYIAGWQAFTQPNDFDSIMSYGTRGAAVTVGSRMAEMGRNQNIDEYSRFNLYVSANKTGIKHLCVRFGTSTVYQDSCSDGPSSLNKATIRAALPPIRNGSDFNITPSRGATDGYAVGWSLMFVPNGQNGRFRVHSVTSKPARSLYWGWSNDKDVIVFNESKGEWNDNVWGLVDMRIAATHSGSRALYLKRPGVLKAHWAGHTEKGGGHEPNIIRFTDDPATDDGYLYFGVMQGGECGDRDQRGVYNTKIGYDMLSENRGSIEFLDNYGNPGLISFRPDSEECGGYMFN
ncbi:hypothetical protein [Aeromonas jandaei]|uniref:hypothetical protein n=1 Tax=Aeromonas jandaei TaxID=650 RepID=UPI003BA12F17